MARSGKPSNYRVKTKIVPPISRTAKTTKPIFKRRRFPSTSPIHVGPVGGSAGGLSGHTDFNEVSAGEAVLLALNGKPRKKIPMAPPKAKKSRKAKSQSLSVEESLSMNAP
jgi:hypothetical protein